MSQKYKYTVNESNINKIDYFIHLSSYRSRKDFIQINAILFYYIIFYIRILRFTIYCLLTLYYITSYYIILHYITLIYFIFNSLIEL